MADRDDLTFGRSTLQGGDTTIIEKVVGDLSLPDLVLRDQPEYAVAIDSQPYAFGAVIDDGESMPILATGDRIYFGLKPIDRFGLGAYSGFYEQHSGLELTNPKGIKEGDGPYDFSSGVFEFEGTIETFANAVGERAISFVWSCLSLDPLWGLDVILYAQALVPTTAEFSIVTLRTPPLALDFDQMKTQAYAKATALDPNQAPIADLISGVFLHFHQTSGETIEVTVANMSVKKIREIKDGEVRNYFED